MRKHLFQGRYGALVAVCAGLCAGTSNLFAQTELGIGDTVHHLDEVVVSAFKRPVPSTQLLRLQTPQAYLPVSVTGLVSEVWTAARATTTSPTSSATAAPTPRCVTATSAPKPSA